MSTVETVAEILAHHGVKGMRWGVRRKATVGPTEVIVSDKRKKIKTSGGKGFPAHSDAVRARVIGQTAKKSGTKALSNQELQDYAKRIQLEQNLKRLSFHEKNAGQKFILTVLGQSGKIQAQDLSNEASAKVKKELIKKIATGK